MASMALAAMSTPGEAAVPEALQAKTAGAGHRPGHVADDTEDIDRETSLRHTKDHAAFFDSLPNCTSAGGVADLQIHKFLHFVQLAHSCRTRHTKLDHARIFGEKHRIPISPHFTPLDRTDYTNPGDRPLFFALPSDLRFVAALARHAGRYQYALSLTNLLK